MDQPITITSTITSTVSTGGSARADQLAYDSVDGVVLSANDADVPPCLTFHLSSEPLGDRPSSGR